MSDYNFMRDSVFLGAELAVDVGTGNSKTRSLEGAIAGPEERSAPVGRHASPSLSLPIRRHVSPHLSMPPSLIPIPSSRRCNEDEISDSSLFSFGNMQVQPCICVLVNNGIRDGSLP